MLNETLFDGQSFSGRARLFPLPNLVMFPHVVQPLHIFEPRYRDLMEDALAEDKLIAMSVLSPGWEQNYEGRPAVYPVACLGRIATHEQLPDGRYNLLLLGLHRVQLVRELPGEHRYRQAEAKLLDDIYPAQGDIGRSKLRMRLLSAFREKLQGLVQQQAGVEKLLSVDMSLGMLSDLVAYTLDFAVEFKAQLLAEINVDERAKLLLEKLGDVSDPPSRAATRFPPDFSRN